MDAQTLKNTYQAYLDKTEEAKTLAREIESLKAAIIEAHNGEPMMVTEEFQSKVSNCTRLTLLEKLVQDKYHVTFQPEDYRVTPYVRLNVSRVKAE